MLYVPFHDPHLSMIMNETDQIAPPHEFNLFWPASPAGVFVEERIGGEVE